MRGIWQLLSWRRRIAVTITAVVVVAIYFWLANKGIVPQAEVCRKGEYGPPDDCPTYDVVSALIGRALVFADEHNGLFVAAFTGTLWFSTHLMWRASISQLRHSEDTAVRQLRAYMRVRAVKLDGLSVGNELVVRLEIQNVGQTPAYDVQIDAGSIVKPFPPKQDEPFPIIVSKGPVSKLIFYPNDEPLTANAPLGFTRPGGLTQQQVDIIKDGTDARLYAYARIRYVDIFKVGRERTFCIFVDATEGRDGRDKYATHFVACPDHNAET